MSEKLYHRPCSVCGCGLDITLDTDTDDISISSPDISPLVKDKQKIVDAYRRVKKLPLSWEKAHRARALIVAGDIIAAFPPMPQLVDNAVALIEWMGPRFDKWGLDDATGRIREFLEHQRKLKESVKRPRCGICAEQFNGVGNRCERHEGM